MTPRKPLTAKEIQTLKKLRKPVQKVKVKLQPTVIDLLDAINEERNEGAEHIRKIQQRISELDAMLINSSEAVQQYESGLITRGEYLKRITQLILTV